MSLRYAYFHSAMRLKSRLSRHWRRRRMRWFLERMTIRGGERILDLGGTPEYWDACPIPLDLTILNLPGTNALEPPPSIHRIRLVEGDACDVRFAPDMSFDIVVSNSVIEHVGPPEMQARMAAEVRRLAPRYWVQTPSIWFPMEAHTNVPFWWFLPGPVKRALIRRWRRILPEWCEMVEGTTVILRHELERMLPDATLVTERVAALPKSYVAFRAG